MRTSKKINLMETIQDKLVFLDSKTKAPLYIYFGGRKNINGVVAMSKTDEPESLYAEGYLSEWDMKHGATVYYSKKGYMFQLMPESEKDLVRIIMAINRLLKSCHNEKSPQNRINAKS
jgi:hypothetical protein